MSRVVKKVSGPYILEATKGQQTEFIVGSSDLNNAQVTINGNLVVLGDKTSIKSTDTDIFDNFITLNAGLKLTDAPLNAGITVNRGSQPDVEIRWNEQIDRWQITNDGINYQSISTQQGAQFLSLVVEDTAPQLGGNLDVNGHTITSAGNVIIEPFNNVQIDGILQLEKQTTFPTVTVPGFNLLYAADVAGGGTGLFVANGQAAHQELVSKRRAIVYSLIF